MKTLSSLKGFNPLNKTQQKDINGGFNFNPIASCSGSGTLGGVNGEGTSSACQGKSSGTRCTINGYAARCTGNGGGFWFL